jgi:hypothetical protein
MPAMAATNQGVRKRPWVKKSRPANWAGRLAILGVAREEGYTQCPTASNA